MPEAQLILASASPRRRELLALLPLAFTVVVAEVEEHEDPATDPREMVAHNAALKADWVAVRHPDDWVLGADSTVCVDSKALNKPADMAEARAMLRQLSGRAHTVFTGLALRRARDGFKRDVSVSSEVVFRKLDEKVISEYLSRVLTLDKAGGYAIQELGGMLLADRKGSLSNIIGLPLENTKQLLTDAGLLA